MASFRPYSHRYASLDSSSDPSPSSDQKRSASSNSGGGGGSSSRALVKARPGDLASNGKNGQNLGSMVKKLMDRRSNPKPRSGRTALPVPADLIAADVKKAAKGSNFSALSRKLFQKGGAGGDAAPKSAGKALTEVKTNTRTLAMVLRSERELLSQNKEYEEEISQLQLLVSEKDREIERLKDLCLKQREEIKALKDAILFPDIMNTQLQELLEKQGSELKQAKRVIPTLQKQVTSLTGQLKCLAEDLAEVRADKYSTKACFDGHLSFPRTPSVFDEDDTNHMEDNSDGLVTSEYGSPDDMFLKDLNPCLTPCFPKTKSQENHESYESYSSPNNNGSYQSNAAVELSPDPGSTRTAMLSKSSEHRRVPSMGSCSSRKICRSDESKWSNGKTRYRDPF